ncbi:MAG: efflux RND transporter periplasmic adaptor subunit [Cyanobacteria bacterium P01_H01_bin.21]
MTTWRPGHSFKLIAGLGLALLLPSCGFFTPSEAQVSQSGRPEAPSAVETARAEVSTLAEPLEYTGTTQPQQQFALRAQTAGEVVALTADIGDAVKPGEMLAQIDSGLLTARVNEAQAELSVRRSEVAEDQVSIADAQAAVAQAKATRDQAKIDADRLRQLANQGATSQQAAEAAELALVNAEQTVNSAEAQVQARQNAIAAAGSRVNAQQAVVAEAKEQLRWVQLTAQQPATVLTRLVDPGDYVQPGSTLFELGNLSTLKVAVQVSELDLGQLIVGQPVQIRLDAFPDVNNISGSITRISPVADTTSRLVTVEVTMTNPDRRIGSGLLARVQFTPPDDERIVVPISALDYGDDETTIFVIEQENDQTTVVARSVDIGQEQKGRVEILSGLEPNEPFVVKSDGPLETGQTVRLSILSEGLGE